jgi:hypothetical protein
MNNLMKAFLIIGVVLFSTSSWSLDCEGRFDIHRDNNPIHKKVSITKTISNAAFEMYEGQIENFHYSVTTYKEGNYTLGIYVGPEYTTGTRTSGFLTDEAPMRLSYVKGMRALNIICQ